MAMAATVQVLTSGVRLREWMWPIRGGIAPRRAMDRPVRDAGRIVVCVDAIAAVETDSNRIQSQPPSTSVAR
jgi:hypothetical protein